MMQRDDRRGVHHDDQAVDTEAPEHVSSVIHDFQQNDEAIVLSQTVAFLP